MAVAAKQELQTIAQELYKKNLDLVQLNREMVLMQELYQAAVNTLVVQEVAKQCLQAIVKFLPFPVGTIFLFDQGKKTLNELATLYSPPYSRSHYLLSSHKKLVLEYESQRPMFQALRSRQKVTITYKQTSLSEHNDQLEHKEIFTALHSLSIYPLWLGSRKLGVCVIANRISDRKLSSQDRKTLKRAMTLCSIALDRVMLYQDLKKANKQLRILDQLKDEFVSIASHELRTPMTAIKSYLWMILNRPQAGETLNPKTHEYLQRALQSTQRLIALVNDMLDVSRIEAGRIELEIDKIDVEDLVSTVVLEVSARAKERKLSIETQLSPNLPVIHGDHNKIHQVLINIVGNALKFTPPGGNITIRVYPKDGMLVFGISDTGKGIAANDIPKLFTKFGRLEHSLVGMAEAGGTGLGLFICQQLIHLHGGKIWLTSQLGKGSTFSFSLPL